MSSETLILLTVSCLFNRTLNCVAFLCMQDKDGVLWRDKLIASARKEFEDARYERDPDIIARLLIGGQDAVIAITDRMLLKARKLVDEEKGSPPGLGDGWAHSSAGSGEARSCRNCEQICAAYHQERHSRLQCFSLHDIFFDAWRVMCCLFKCWRG